MGNHADWRKSAKKARRKRIRQILAEVRCAKEEEERKCRENSPSYQKLIKEYEEQEAFEAEEQSRLRHEAEIKWLKVEEEARIQWILLQKKLAEAREERVRQITRIRLDWETEQKRLEEIKAAKEQEREENEQKQRKLEEEIDNFIKNGGSTPEHLKCYHEKNPNKPICPFFKKTAACRFRDSCSRNHVKPGVSRVLLMPNFYSHYSLEQAETEHGDTALEFENHETYSHFKEFFFDILPEMERLGKVRQLKVCCNREHHLRGNVYVEYSSTREAVKSFKIFNGRWYGGKQLSVEFCTIESWKSAICGLHSQKRCPKGSSCNFLHVFRNPKNLFHYADRDEHRTPPKSTYLQSDSDMRNCRWSESPERLPLTSLHKSHKNGHEKRRKHSRHRSKSRSPRKRRFHHTHTSHNSENSSRSRRRN